MLHDHHGEEISRRRRGIYGTDYDPEDIPRPPSRPSFSRWVCESAWRYVWFLATIVLVVAALIILGVVEGLTAVGDVGAEMLNKPSILMFCISMLNLALFIHSWRAHKYRVIS